MKQILLFAFIAATALGEIFHGTLLPQKCRNDDPATHTTECALKCAESGLGIALKGNGDYAPFAPSSQARALTFLKSITRKTDLRIEVNGKRTKSGAIEIETIRLEDKPRDAAALLLGHEMISVHRARCRFRKATNHS